MIAEEYRSSRRRAIFATPASRCLENKAAVAAVHIVHINDAPPGDLREQPPSGPCDYGAGCDASTSVCLPFLPTHTVATTSFPSRRLPAA